MGRRKIEIQPITHERNRSVTFLKRKNGLFKKAYELGVLCSVDVAVIIFEERPGHHVKLYQYCSGDVDGMVERHLQFDGERDLKTPADFSNNKNDEAADDDEEAEDDDGSRVKKEKHASQSAVPTKSGPSHSNGSSHGNVPIRPAQSTSQDASRSHPDMSLRGSHGRMGSGSQMNGVPILPVSNERNSTSSRSNSLGMPGSGISMPLSLPIPPIAQQAQKRPRLENPLAPPPGITYPYRLNVDLNTFPPTAHATSLPPQPSLQQQRHVQSDLGLSFPSNLGAGMDAFASQSGFDFPSSRSRPLGYSAPGQQGGGTFPGGGGLNGMFGSRPGPQTTNMLMDLLNSTAATADVSSFEWPGSPQGTAQLDASTASNDWLEFLASSAAQQSPHSTSLSLGLPTPTTSRAASNSVSSTTSSRPPFHLPSASSSPPCLSPGRKRSRDEACFDDPGSGVLKAMKLGSDGRRSVG